jgi:hypothetical protein
MAAVANPFAERRASSAIFSDAMIIAIREGRKTQTRRIVRGGANLHTRAQLLRVSDGVATFGDSIPDDPVPIYEKCPYGIAGDLIWVKETFAKLGDGTVVYRADCQDNVAVIGERRVRVEKWTTPIFLSRALSRMTLEITNVRCMRLRDTSQRDAVAEGITRTPQGTFIGDGEEFADARTAFFFAWDGIQEHRGAYATSQCNPFVWAISFRLVGSP